MSDELNDVPKNRVGVEVQNFINFGASKVEAFEQPDGNWTVKATTNG